MLTGGNELHGEIDYAGIAPWKLRVALAFVVFSIIALAAIPIAVERVGEKARHAVLSVAEPARSEITALHVALAVGGSAVSDYMATRDPSFVDTYRRTVARGDSIRERLRTLVQDLGPAAIAHSEELWARADRWEASVDRLLDGPPTAEESQDQRVTYEDLLMNAARLDEAILAETRIRLRRMQAVVAYRLISTLVLLPVAVGSAIVLVWFGRRHLIAEQSHDRARDERAMRELARAFTGARDVGEAMNRLATGALSLSRASGAFVEQTLSGRDHAEVVAAAGDGVPAVGERVVHSESFIVQPDRRGDSGSASRESGEEPRLAAVGRVSPARVAMVVPLRSEESNIGALVLVTAPEAPGLPREDVDRIRVVGDLASLALRRLILLEDAQRRQREVERLMESKSRLIRGFTHDVKNPLGAADGYLALLLDGIVGELDPAQRQSIERVSRSIRNALELIDQLTELARVESKHVELSFSAVDVCDVARDVVEEYRAGAGAKDLQVKLLLDEELVAKTDGMRLRQILANLISNAIKYTPPNGHVVVRAGRKQVGSAEDLRECTVVDVEDTGPGIPPERAEDVFLEFTRLTPGASPGAGLGLAISRRIARMLGGDITLRSAPGAGSTFTVWIPAEPDRERRGSA